MMRDITITVSSTMESKRLATALAFGEALRHDHFQINTCCLNVANSTNAFCQCFARARAAKKLPRSDFTLFFGDEISKTESVIHVQTVVEIIGPAPFPTIAFSRLTVPPDTGWEIDESEAQPDFIRSLKIGLYREAISRALYPYLTRYSIGLS